MTLRASLARYVRGLLEEPSTPTPSDPPTPSPLSIPPTTTPTTTTPAGTLEAGLVGMLLQTFREMQTEQLTVIRGMVTDILQGREVDLSQLPQPEPQPSRMPFDPVDYDSPGIEDLPAGIQGVWAREEQEQNDVRQLRTEQEVLAQQLDEARRALMDPQGPVSAPSS